MIKYLPLAIAVAIASLVTFMVVYLRSHSLWLRLVLVAVALLMAVPSISFASNYLLGVPDGPLFVAFHSITGVEASAGLVEAFLGVVCGWARVRPRSIRILVPAICAVPAFVLLITPFAKQIFYGLDYTGLEDRWNDGVCLQTSSSTCVPSSCATLVRMLGGELTERELAVAAGTTRRGTEIWYMKRALRTYGYEIEAREVGSWEDAVVPSMIGVKVGRAGHVVVMVSKSDGGPEIADPLGMRRSYTWAGFERRYHPARCCFVLRGM